MPGERHNQSFMRLSLRANFSWTFVGNVVYAACQWGMLMALAKLGSPGMVGVFALGLAITGPIYMFLNLHLRTIQATDARQEYQFGDYLGVRLATTALALLVTAGVTLAVGYPWETGAAIVAVGCAKAFESISDIFYGLLQRLERMDRIATGMMLKGVVSLLTLAIGVYLSGSVVWGVVGMAGAWAAVLAFYDIPQGLYALRHTPKFHMSSALRERVAVAARLAWMALPLGFGILLVSLSTAIPRYFVERILGAESLGIFAAIAYIQAAGITVISALAAAANPRLAQHYVRNDARAFRTLLYTLVAIALALGGAGVLVAWLIGDWVLTLIYRPEYGAYNHIFVLVMIAAGIGYVGWFVGDAMTAVRRLRAQALLFLTMTIATIGACAWFIPLFGLTGAALATMVTAVVQAVGGLLIVEHALRALPPVSSTVDSDEAALTRSVLFNQ
ncbi:MAG: lipopolysaccharide biosynthesis protein [Roseiflexus sp.]|nr:lipopolysaccharide biosynthesis protein [Roseiflexus sp.]MCS7289794.1 lipopolysaccharide biosynthesis protein [Roseiflexus sp.]MDW8232491.1 lipopolysaccharide biosynthesis protein [Roseiflexaceae bacterium]